MQWIPLPITGGSYKNVDEKTLNNIGSTLLDGYLDETGAWNLRPGLTSFVSLATGRPVDGMHWWASEESLIAVSDGKVFKITDRLGTFANVTGDTLEKNVRPTFAECMGSLYMANGGKIVKLATTGTTAYLTDADAPTTVTHVATLDQYLIANETGTGRLHYSRVAEPDNWDGEFITAESNPDRVFSVLTFLGEIYLAGPHSHEVWVNDGASPFVPARNAFTGSGWAAPYSVAWVAGTIFGLDEFRQLVRLQGRTPVTISKAMNRYIQEFGTVSDARADHFVFAGRPFYMVSFPTEGKTLVLDASTGDPLGWAEWSYYDTVTGEHKQWLGNCVTRADEWGYTFVGDRRTGKIWLMDSGTHLDGDDLIRTVRVSGNIDHGTYREKKSAALRVRLKTRVAGGTLTVRWRDDGQEAWSNPRQISLGDVTDQICVRRINQLGRYQTRQWEFSVSNSPAVIIGAEELAG